jgi:hypothetical protein
MVVATEVVGSAVPPPSAAIDNSGEERMVAEMAIFQVVSEPQVRTASGGGNVMMVSAEQGVPPHPPTRDHETIALAATETPLLVIAPVGGGGAEASAPGAWSALNFEVIDLDTTKLLSNDRDIYVVVLERLLAVPVESEVEAPEAATSAVASSA